MAPRAQQRPGSAGRATRTAGTHRSARFSRPTTTGRPAMPRRRAKPQPQSPAQKVMGTLGGFALGRQSGKRGGVGKMAAFAGLAGLAFKNRDKLPGRGSKTDTSYPRDTAPDPHQN